MTSSAPNNLIHLVNQVVKVGADRPCENQPMNAIIARMGAATFVSLLAAYVAGLVSWLRGGLKDPSSQLFPIHLYLGLFAVLLTLGVHCLAFIYLLGTGRWVKEVALAYSIADEPLPKCTRELKRRTFPVALLAMVVAIVTAAAGAAVQMRLVSLECPFQRRDDHAAGQRLGVHGGIPQRRNQRWRDRRGDARGGPHPRRPRPAQQRRGAGARTSEDGMKTLLARAARRHMV